MASEQLRIDSVVQRDPEVLAAKADEDLVMVNIMTGSYYGVSNSARDIWEAIEEPKQISDIIDELIKTYDVERRKCEDETLLFLEKLLDERLLAVIK